MPRPAPWPVRVRAEGRRLVLEAGDPGAAIDLDGAWFFAREWGHVEHAAEQRARVVDGRAELVLVAGDAPARDVLAGVLRLPGSPPTGYTVAAPIRAALAALLAAVVAIAADTAFAALLSAVVVTPADTALAALLSAVVSTSFVDALFDARAVAVATFRAFAIACLGSAGQADRCRHHGGCALAEDLSRRGHG